MGKRVYGKMTDRDRGLCQITIDCYEGEHGPVKNFLKNEVKEKIGHTEFMHGVWNGLNIFCLQGSNGNPDWIDNIKFWKKVCPKNWFGKSVFKRFRLCKGFMGQVKTVISRIRRVIFDILKWDQIIIIGHSLGGILSIIIGLILSFWMEVEVVTFGAPLGGSMRWARWGSKRIKITNYIYGDDPVPHVPFAFWGNARPGKNVYLKEKEEDPWWNSITRLTFLREPYDHEPLRYLNS